MPIYTRDTLQSDRLPWVDIDDFEFFVLGRDVAAMKAAAPPPGPDGHVPFWGTYQLDPLPSTRQIVPASPRERIIVVAGEVSVETEYGRVTLKRRDFLEIPPGGAKLTNVSIATVEIARIAGHWKQVIRNEVAMFEPRHPCDYHYHDGDEYWFVSRGHFTLDYDGAKYAMQPGRMMAAGMGFEHGVSAPEEQFEAIVFATQLEGRKRDGHLNRAMHGDPVKGRQVPADVDRAFLLEPA